MNRIILVFGVFFIVSCGSSRLGKQALGIVEGKVVYEQGNRMPGEVMKKASGVKREICIFELTNLGSGNNSLIPFEEIKNNPLKTAISDEEGNFKIELEVGKYTLLIKEKNGYFVPLLDKENNLNPIMVERGKTNLGTYVINYAAYY